MVQEALVTRMRGSKKDLRNLGVKKAPFVVLIGAGMPSVLAEISFVTNRQEAQLLKTSGYKQRDRRVAARGGDELPARAQAPVHASRTDPRRARP